MEHLTDARASISWPARTKLRHWLMRERIDYNEDKGLLSSYFVIFGLTPSQAATLKAWAQKQQGGAQHGV